MSSPNRWNWAGIPVPTMTNRVIDWLVEICEVFGGSIIIVIIIFIKHVHEPEYITDPSGCEGFLPVIVINQIN